MSHNDRISKSAQATRLTQFLRAYDTVKKFGFTVAEVARLIDLQPRTLFRILDESRPASHTDVIQLQTAALTLLKLQMKMLADPKLDPRKVAL